MLRQVMYAYGYEETEEQNYNRDNGYLSPLQRTSSTDPSLLHVATNDSVLEYLDSSDRRSYWK